MIFGRIKTPFAVSFLSNKISLELRGGEPA